jgi:predicted transcriptional regulator
MWQSGVYIGLHIDSFAGEIAKFKINWHSDLTPEEKSGFYFDDFIIYGYEFPPLKFDIGIEKVEIYPLDKPIVAGDKFQIKANISNNGIKPVYDYSINIQVTDFTGRLEEVRQIGTGEIISLQPGEAQWYTWMVKPQVAGLYYINISLEMANDEFLKNNFDNDEAVDVYVYYNSFESKDPTWLAEDGWTNQNVSSDPDPSQHSWSRAWYVGNTSSNLLDTDMQTSLYSPIIDLDGAQENLLFGANQIRIGFKWYGKASVADGLHFEYSLDHNDQWEYFVTPEKSRSIISGDATDRWYSWDTLGDPSLFGHHVQFRWRMESDSVFSIDEMGYYIDDFKIWIIQEQFGRPIISGCQVNPGSIINDIRDMALITCQVDSGSAELVNVLIDLESLGGADDQQMVDDGTSGDHIADDGVYSIMVKASPTVTIGEKLLKISVLDQASNFDYNYVKIIIKENRPPRIESQMPLNATVKLLESERLEFSVAAFDPDGDALTYNWYLDSELVSSQSMDYFEFISTYHDALSAGNYVLHVEVADDGIPKRTDHFEWNIEVIDVLPDFHINKNDVFLQSYNVTVDDEVRIEVRIHNLQPTPEKNVTVHFIQQTTDATIPDKVFSIHNITLFPGFGSTSVETVWLANISTKYLKIIVDPENRIIELNENNNEIIVPINVSLPPDPLPPPTIKPDRTEGDAVSIGWYVLIGGLVAGMLSIFISVGTEFGRYNLYLFFNPLYYRVTGDKILEHEVRSKIYLHIRAHPGDHYRSIMNQLKLKNGTLVHHLARLEQEELIRSERDGYFKRFYPVRMRIPKSEVGMYYPEEMPTYNIGEHQVSDIQLKIIKIIRGRPGITQKEIALQVDESRRVVNYHIKLLIQHELIKLIKSGRKTECYVVEGNIGA